MKTKNLFLITLISCFILLLPLTVFGQNSPETASVTQAKKLNATTVELSFSNNQKMLLDFYGENIFRMFQDNSGQGMRSPQATPLAEILIENPRKPSANLMCRMQAEKLPFLLLRLKLFLRKKQIYSL